MNEKSLLVIDIVLAFVFLTGIILFYEVKGDFLISCIILLVLGSAAIARVTVAFLMKRS